MVLRGKGISMNELCLVPECIRTPVIRGLCNSHYQTASGLVHQGAVTWKGLEKEGKSLPAVDRKPSRNWFLTKKDEE